MHANSYIVLSDRDFTKHYFAGAEKEYVAQPIRYLPFGEEYVSEHTASPYTERFTFTGKERDLETGYTYHEASYYDASLMCSWFSVDPLSDKYPSLSPYNYCAWNPVKLVDLDGMEVTASSDWYKDANGHVHWDANVHSQAEIKNGETYIGRTVCMVEERDDNVISYSASVSICCCKFFFPVYGPAVSHGLSAIDYFGVMQ